MKSLIERNIAINGKDWILSKCAEECTELAGAILKHKNKGSSETDILAERSDLVVALSGWQKSRGARREIEKAKAWIECTELGR